MFRPTPRPHGETTVTTIARSLNVPGLVALRLMLVDLKERCQNSLNGRAAVLPHGGGSAGIILLAHLPYLQTHVEYLDVVIGKVRGVVERRAQEQQMAAAAATQQQMAAAAATQQQQQQQRRHRQEQQQEQEQHQEQQPEQQQEQQQQEQQQEQQHEQQQEQQEQQQWP